MEIELAVYNIIKKGINKRKEQFAMTELLEEIKKIGLNKTLACYTIYLSLTKPLKTKDGTFTEPLLIEVPRWKIDNKQGFLYSLNQKWRNTDEKEAIDVLISCNNRFC